MICDYNIIEIGETKIKRISCTFSNFTCSYSLFQRNTFILLNDLNHKKIMIPDMIIFNEPNISPNIFKIIFFRLIIISFLIIKLNYLNNNNIFIHILKYIYIGEIY
jgi:hypothetical protein